MSRPRTQADVDSIRDELPKCPHTWAIQTLSFWYRGGFAPASAVADAVEAIKEVPASIARQAAQDTIAKHPDLRNPLPKFLEVAKAIEAGIKRRKEERERAERPQIEEQPFTEEERKGAVVSFKEGRKRLAEALGNLPQQETPPEPKTAEKPQRRRAGLTAEPVPPEVLEELGGVDARLAAFRETQAKSAGA